MELGSEVEAKCGLEALREEVHKAVLASVLESYLGACLGPAAVVVFEGVKLWCSEAAELEVVRILGRGEMRVKGFTSVNGCVRLWVRRVMKEGHCEALGL